MDNLTYVIAAVIFKADRVLICQRPIHKRHGGLWEFPGGKLEAGETLLEAARRELQEELSVQVVRVGQIYLALHDPGSEFVIQFTDVEIEGIPAAVEHQELAWINPRAILSYSLAPSDRKFAEYWLDGHLTPRD